MIFSVGGQTMLRRMKHMTQNLRSARRERESICRPLAIRLEQLESRHLLTTGTFSLAGVGEGTDWGWGDHGGAGYWDEDGQTLGFSGNIQNTGGAGATEGDSIHMNIGGVGSQPITIEFWVENISAVRGVDYA